MRQTEYRPVVAIIAPRPHHARMKTAKSAPLLLTAVQRMALRDSMAVLVSSAGLLARHIDRLPREKRDAQLAALNDAAAEVQRGVELLLEERL